MSGETEPVHTPDIDQWHNDGGAHSPDETSAAVALGQAELSALDAPKTGVVWTDSQYITNRFGEWTRGVPRYDLTKDDIATLGPGFEPAPAMTPPSAKDVH